MGLFSRGAAKELRCSFCDKAQADVAKLIAGPVACICDECVSVCIDILGDDAANQGRRRQYDSVLEVHGGPPTSLGAGGRCGLCGMSLSLNDMTLVESRGLLCRPCISAVAAASADSPDPNDPQQAP